MKNLNDRILRVAERLECLEEEKCQIEKKIDNSLKDIMRLTKTITKAERDVQKAAKNKLSRECQERLRCDICRLKKEQKRAKKVMSAYDRQICEAYKQYDRCSKEISK
ncbi:hypothetical protein Trydic_g11077 [Trypoxylus dichotomus]